jgi:quercetin dioxygenase-like cupin family protein
VKSLRETPNSSTHINDRDPHARQRRHHQGTCARTAWHTHPLGQTLIITMGCGWVQVEGGPREEVLPGDVVWFPPGVRNWHGATATQGMTHLAISEALDGKTVDWMEKVSDQQYGN